MDMIIMWASCCFHHNVWMWELDHKKSRAPKNWCFWTVMLEKTLGNHLDSKEIKPVNPKGNQSWICIGRTEAEAPILWPPAGENWLIGKDHDGGKDWRQEKGMTEDENVRWDHLLNIHEFEQALVDSEGQGSRACCSQWGHKELNTTEQLNWTECYSYSPLQSKLRGLQGHVSLDRRLSVLSPMF